MKILADFQICIRVPLIKNWLKQLVKLEMQLDLIDVKSMTTKQFQNLLILDFLTRFADFLLRTYVGNVKWWIMWFREGGGGGLKQVQVPQPSAR